MKFIAMLMALAISLSAYEFEIKDDTNFYKYRPMLNILGKDKQAYCPDGLVDSVLKKAKIADTSFNNYTNDIIADRVAKAKQYEYARIAQKIDKQMNDETNALYDKYMNIASKIAEDMCDIRDLGGGSDAPYKSKLSPEEVYQHLEEYFK